MTLFTFKSKPLLSNWNAKLAVGAVLAVFLSASPFAWSGEHDRHNGGHSNGHKERQRDSHSRRDNPRHDKHRDQRSRHEQHGRHSKREHYARTEPRHHDVHRRHDKHYRDVHRHHKHHRSTYYGTRSRHYNHHYHHGRNEAAFLLGGVILGAVLSDASRASDYYYDGYELRSYRNMLSSSCYQSYYENGRRVLVEVPLDFCRAY